MNWRLGSGGLGWYLKASAVFFLRFPVGQIFKYIIFQ
jgi:hypothetical protein